MEIKTDLDLPPAYRTQANLWKAKFFELRRELLAANKGIRRLRKKLDNAPNTPLNDDACHCANGSLCEFFEKENETCLYGKI